MMDDSASILSTQRKNYQELIAQNTISVFDFRNYLFARQISLLEKLDRPYEACVRGKLFISGFTIVLLGKRVLNFHLFWIINLLDAVSP